MHFISKKIFLAGLFLFPAAPIHADRHDHCHNLTHAEAIEIIRSQRKQIRGLKLEYGFKGTVFGAILALTVPPLYKFIFK